MNTKPDPFAKAKAIRAGELDAELPDYEVLTGWLQRVPKTWIPGLLNQIVVTAIEQDVFRASGLVTFAGKCEQRHKEPGHGVLR